MSLLFHLLARSQVNRHAQHMDGLAGTVVIAAAEGANPSHTAVRERHTILFGKLSLFAQRQLDGEADGSES